MGTGMIVRMGGIGNTENYSRTPLDSSDDVGDWGRASALNSDDLVT